MVLRPAAAVPRAWRQTSTCLVPLQHWSVTPVTAGGCSRPARCVAQIVATLLPRSAPERGSKHAPPLACVRPRTRLKQPQKKTGSRTLRASALALPFASQSGLVVVPTESHMRLAKLALPRAPSLPNAHHAGPHPRLCCRAGMTSALYNVCEGAEIDTVAALGKFKVCVGEPTHSLHAPA